MTHVESTGAIGPRAVRLLAQLAKDVKRKGATDGTVYGTARTSTRSFFVHHLYAVAAGVMHADALTLENAAASSAFFDTRGASRAPGESTASWEVTGVLVEGGVPFGERSEPTFLFRRAAGAIF